MQWWERWTGVARRPVHALRPHVDLVLVAVVTVASFTPFLEGRGTALGWEGPRREVDLLAVVLVLGHTLPLALRSRAPAWCLLLVSVAAFAYQCLGYRPTLASVAVYIALLSVGSSQVRHRAVTLAAWLLGYAALSVVLLRLGSPVPPVELVEFVALPVGCWLAGSWAGASLARQREHQARDLEEALEEERAGLARDLHDVVTHHVTAMVMQADALAYVPAGDRDATAAGSGAIATSGRRALADLRDLLEVLQPDHDGPSVAPGTQQPGPGGGRRSPRTPTVLSVDELVETARRAGQPVTLETDGSARPLDGLVALALHRVVQEGLTNALKHAPRRQTLVQLSYGRPDLVRVDVVTEGPPSETSGGVSGGSPGPGGRGLTGLRRRVELAGGRLSSEQRPDGAFVLGATLPTVPQP